MKKYYDSQGIEIYNDDNLKVLRSLADCSVNLIYSDILYNTGKKFDDYNDNLGTAQSAMKWYYPRFKEMKRVLKEDGTIMIHCNWRLDSYIRILMDQLFGEKSFRNRIYRKHSEYRNFVENFDPQIDIILYYVKNPNKFTFNEIRECRTTPKCIPLFENGYVKGKSTIRSYNNEIIDLKDKHCIVNKAQMERLVNEGEILIKDGLPYRLTTVKSIGNLWDSPEMLDNYSRVEKAKTYDTPKPEAILERIIRMCSNEGDTVADFFLGGGTTAVVAKRLGRKGIFCDINKKACAITVKKLKNHS